MVQLKSKVERQRKEERERKRESEREGEGEERRAGTHNLGFEGRLDFPVLQLLPVNPPEEGVGSHVLFSLWTTPKTLQGLLGQELWGDGGLLSHSLSLSHSLTHLLTVTCQ